jgi:hypothetical protein
VLAFLSKIELTFTVRTRGCVIVPIALTDPELQVRAGDAIQLRSHNFSLDTQIKWIEWITGNTGRRLAFLLPEEVDESQIPPEAEIWVENSK